MEVSMNSSPSAIVTSGFKHVWNPVNSNDVVEAALTKHAENETEVLQQTQGRGSAVYQIERQTKQIVSAIRRIQEFGLGAFLVPWSRRSTESPRDPE